MSRSVPAWALLVVSVLLAAACGGGDGGAGETTEDVVRVQPSSVAVIDPKSNRIVAAIPIEGGPVRLTVSADSVSVLSSDARTISLIDANALTVVEKLVVKPTAIDLVAGGENLWVGSRPVRPPGAVEDAARAPGSVVQLEPEGGDIVRTIGVPPLGPPPTSVSDMGPIAFGAEAVWFLSGNQTVSRIDPASARVAATLRFDGQVSGVEGASVAVGEGGVWVSAHGGVRSGVVMRIDPETNTGLATIAVPGAGPVAAGLGGVWIADKGYGSEAVWQIDPATNRQVRSIKVGPLPLGVAAGEGAVWAATSDGVVSRIDPTSGKVVARVRVGGTPLAVAVGERRVWVAVA